MKHIFLILLMSILTFCAVAQEHSLDKSIHNFNKKEYQLAAKGLEKLIEDNPDSPMINYYLGAAQTELGMYSKQQLSYLKKAYKAGIHKRINYYLAIQYHAAENWKKASTNYRMYKINISEEEQKQLLLNVRISQCKEHINPFIASQEKPKEQEENPKITTEEPVQDSIPTPKKDMSVAKADSNIIVTDSVIHTTKIIKKKSNEFKDFPIEFSIRDDIKYKNTKYFRTKEGKEIFLKALAAEKKLNQTQKLSEKMRQDYALSDFDSERDSLAHKIREFEEEAYKLKSEYTQLYYDAYLKEKNYWDKKSSSDIQKELESLEETTFNVQKKQIKEVVVQPTETDNLPKELTKEEEVAPQKEPENHAVNQQAIEKTPTTPATPKVITQTTKKTTIEPTDNQLVYKIQIGAFRKPSKSFNKTYKRLNRIRKINKTVNEKGITVYTIGHLSNLQDAAKLQNQIRKEGVKDAFIVIYHKGKRVSLKEAQEIEKNL